MNAYTRTQPIRDRTWLAFLIGAALLLLSLSVRLWLGTVALRFPFVIFLPPVIVTTFLGGLLPGLAAALGAGVLADVTLIAPPGYIVPNWPDGWIALGFYVLTVGIDIALIHGMSVAFRRAAVAEAALRNANEQLENRVVERTAALEQQVVEREAAEAQLRHLQRIESIGQLTGGIAHDFNNMLSVIIGALEMARRRLKNPERVGAYIDAAESGAKRAAQLVARLLAFSRQQQLEPSVLDVNALVDGMTELLQRTIGEQVRIRTALARNLWPCLADAIQLETAILNLAVNSRDAMPDGGELCIETGNETVAGGIDPKTAMPQPGDYVLITVRDTGSGMPRDVVDRAFDPFFTTKAVGKGTGLGLSQVYGFFNQSGGHVLIRSDIGKGTEIRAYLPRCRAEPANATTVQPSHAATPARGHETILVVEDEPEVRRINVDALGELGYTVIEAPDGKTALSLLSAEPRVAALLTDVVMPEMNGRQLADRARTMRPGLRVVFATAFPRDTLLHEGVDGAPTAVLSKPFSLPQLAAKLREVLDAAVAVEHV